MATRQELESAARILASSMTPREASRLVSENYNIRLKDEEKAKSHPMNNFMMPHADWQAEKAHMMDGGGVVDDSELAVEIMTAMLNDDQEIFWPDLIHVYKSWMKITGRMNPLPGTGMFLRGVAGKPDPTNPNSGIG